MTRSAAPPLARAQFIPPMKALNTGRVPSGIWDCEIKFDGYRAVAVLNRGRAELWSRNRKPMTADYPEVVAALSALKCRTAVIDGEIVAMDESGHSRFQLLQNRGQTGARPPIVYYVFDLMQCDGTSLIARPLEERRTRLKALVKRGAPALKVSPSFRLAPAKLLTVARQQGLEGVIAKRPGSPYEPDRRSETWIKCKLIAEQEFVIGGFTPPQHSRAHFGAILIGYYEKDRLRYAGKVGTGYDRASLAALHAKFLALRREACPFANLPMERRPRFGQGMNRAAMREVTWVKPSLVAQIKFAEWTNEGLLRQPVFLGLRKDKAAKDVRREVGQVS